MVDWLAGKRVRGTSSERTSLQDSVLGGTGVGGWVQVARTTLESANSTINVSSLPDKRYYMVLGDFRNTSTVNTYYRLDGVSTQSYSARRSDNGGATDTNLNYTVFAYHGGGASGSNQLAVTYIANKSNKEKLHYSHGMSNNGTGAGNAPYRVESTGKHAQTSTPISSIQGVNLSTTLGTGSEVVVLGYDPADTHTTNFWEELASVELTSAGDTIDSGTFTAKKYLWFQCYTKGANTETQFRLNNDSSGVNGSSGTYASRRSNDGGSDSTFTYQTQSKINATGGGASYTACFMNGFVINNASNEKLVITHQIAEDAGTGEGNAPRRSEGVTKWANTSSQITSIQLINNSTGVFSTGSILKVWGAD